MGVSSSSSSSQLPNHIRVLCWNVDGLEKRELIPRAKAIVEIIRQIDSPDIIFFQELVPETLPFYQKELKLLGYTFSFPTSVPQMNFYPESYFNGIFINTKRIPIRIQKDRCYRIDFDNSRMGRNLLAVPVQIFEIDIVLMDTHLESLARNSETRTEQLKQVLKLMEESENCIFGGDTDEPQIPLPSSIRDAWIEMGSPEETEFSWNQTRNFNKDGNTLARYDRILFKLPQRSSSEMERKEGEKSKVFFKISNFQLIGTERVERYCKTMHPSDHFGIEATFSISKE